MTLPTCLMTKTARAHLEKIIRDTARQWGYEQAVIYRHALSVGFQEIAKNHKKFNSPYRDDMAKGTDFSLHHIEHHYIAFQAHGGNSVIIVGILPERMNIPERLKELQSMSQHEIDTILSLIEKQAE